MISPKNAPYYVTLREGVAAADAAPITVANEGVNCRGYKRLHVQVVPSGGANPTIVPAYWSDEAGAFVKDHSLVFAGVGADIPFEFTIEAGGRILIPMVTVLAAGAVTIAGSVSEMIDE